MVNYTAENDRLVLTNYEVETAYLALRVTDRAPSAYCFLEKTIFCYPLEARGIELEGEPATQIKEEIVSVLDTVLQDPQDHPHFVVAAHGLLRTLRGDEPRDKS